MRFFREMMRNYFGGPWNSTPPSPPPQQLPRIFKAAEDSQFNSAKKFLSNSIKPFQANKRCSSIRPRWMNVAPKLRVNQRPTTLISSEFYWMINEYSVQLAQPYKWKYLNTFSKSARDRRSRISSHQWVIIFHLILIDTNFIIKVDSVLTMFAPSFHLSIYPWIYLSYLW